MERDESFLADNSYTERAGANGTAAQVELKETGLGMICWSKNVGRRILRSSGGGRSRDVVGFGDSSGEIQTHCSVCFLNDRKDAGDRSVGIGVRNISKSIIV